MFRRSLSAIIFVIAVAGFSAMVWMFAFSAQMESLAKRGEAHFSVAANRLSSSLQRFRELAVLLSEHPVLTDLVETPARDASQALVLLQRSADKTGSRDIMLLDGGGRTLAASDPDTGTDLEGAGFVRRALQGALGFDHSIHPVSGERIFSYASPVFSPLGPVIGVVVVKLNVEALESDWRADPQAVFFVNDDGVVFLSNRSELVFQARDGLVQDTLERGAARSYPGVVLQPFLTHRVWWMAGYELWRLEGGPYLPARALHLVRPLPVIGLTGEALVDVDPALWVATLQALVAAATCLVFGALVMWLMDRRRALQERLAIEAHANTVLESRVIARTQALSDANLALRHEVAERLEAEAALKRAQAELVQAEKLSALGQMSAGISHELNQPLMAIRSFAENAEIFLERGNSEMARRNLSRISTLALRMGRIMKNLRGFARQEIEPLGRVDVVAVIESALEMTEVRLEQNRIRLVYAPPPGPVWVRGGEVRLAQVVINLINNAADAMAHAPRRELVLTLEADEGVTLELRDTGAGIAAPDRIFDPFYSTKEVGASEGMGLGLSISYAIVQSFGGTIQGANAPTCGAVFTIRLHRWSQEQAA
ncbi:MAG: two-component system C4-dicarboxylate transport sensor histidine kinase DctB [Paracoccaceae bacterium]|jgi:two-component system C4-dicarboxylate transport sensor histidine kinase DctB